MVGMIQEVFKRIQHKCNRQFFNSVSNSNTVPYTLTLSNTNHMSIDFLIFLSIFIIISNQELTFVLIYDVPLGRCGETSPDESDVP